MSPNDQKTTPGRLAIACALSVIARDVTHAGQPGPCTSSTSRGSRRSIPCLTRLWVWPPQTSMITQGRVTVRRISSSRPAAMRPSRYSSRKRISALPGLLRLQLSQLVHLLEELERALRLLLVDDAQGEAHVYEHVVAGLGGRDVLDARLARDASELDLGHPHALPVVDLLDLTRDGQTHTSSMGRRALRYSAPRAGARA